MEPRTSPNQKIPTRPARSHHNKQRPIGKFTINGQDLEKHFAEYVTVCFPDTPRETRRDMVNVLLYAAKRDRQIPTPNDLNKMFKDDIVTPSDIPLNPRQNG